MNKLTKISVIIPSKPVGEIENALAALKKVDYPPYLIEVIIAQGLSPSRQRNAATQKARGKILYFLDNDSEISEQAFNRCIQAFSKKRIGKEAPVHYFSLLPLQACQFIDRQFFTGHLPKNEVAVVGGPSIWNRPESFWSSIAGIIFESFFAYFIMTSRFRPTGTFRATDERELVLCNLAIKREIFLKTQGFKEELYPNEENEFLHRLTKKGYDLVYHPGVFVNRPRRKSLIQILNMFYNYGRGRTENIRLSGIKHKELFLLPLLLLLYIFSLTLNHSWVALIPLFIYFGMGLGSALGFATRRKKTYLAIFLPFLFLLVHLSYAIGLIEGAFTNFEKRKKVKSKSPITLIKYKRFNQGWDKAHL